MRVYPISKKIGVLDNNTKKNLQDLIRTMEAKAKTEITPNGCGFTRTYTTGGILKESNNALYGGNICGIVNNTSVVDFNNKRYVVDNITGAVTPEETKWNNVLILSSKKLISGISGVINQLKENFDNTEVVKHYKCGIKGFTEKGAKLLQEAIDNVNAGRVQ